MANLSLPLLFLLSKIQACFPACHSVLREFILDYFSRPDISVKNWLTDFSKLNKNQDAGYRLQAQAEAGRLGAAGPQAGRSIPLWISIIKTI